MNELTSLALELQAFCDQRNWQVCIIGGLAVQHWGEPRFTKDVDLTLLTGFGNEEPFIDQFLAAYESRLPDAKAFAQNRRILLLRSTSGIGIDISLGGLDFETEAVQRARPIELEKGAFVRICTAEDLIVFKAFADRPQDHLDIKGILTRQGTRNLNWKYILKHLAVLCELKESPDIIPRLERAKKQIAATEPAS